MNAPFVPEAMTCRLADLRDPDERRAIETFIAAHCEGTAFHRPVWLEATASGTGNEAMAIIGENAGEIAAYLPLTAIHSPIFGRVMVSSGFAVGGGLLATPHARTEEVFAAAEELALRQGCPTLELRGGPVPRGRDGWSIKTDSHCGFVVPLAADDDAQLKAIPRKQRAEVRKGLANDFVVTVGRAPADRDAHYTVYAESVRNLGTPVFPRALFEAVLDGFGEDADILTVSSEGRPVASVLSLYHDGAVLPYWGGGVWDARRLRANDRMYFELMRHARERGCERFDFGRSKTGSGAYHFKRNWGFEPEPLAYASWTAPGAQPRDADPTSAKHAAQIAVWQRLPLSVANRIGPWIARGLG